MIVRFAMFLLCVLTGRAVADADSAVATALSRGLDRERYWLDLVQYRRGLLGGHTSLVKSSTFFLDTAEGPRSPAKELEATIRALLAPVDSARPSKHAACDFPARRAWLIDERVLADDSLLPRPACRSLDEWSRPGMYRSLSIVFATGYLKNPASYFGHLFLKFNSHPVRSGQNLMNRTVGYGADVSARDNPVLYALKGLLGGYVALYSQDDFYTQNFHYGSNQLRDLYEYELDLTPQEVERISLRIWELFGEKFQYYFLNQNCAYFIVDPLDKELGVGLIPGFLPYSLPKHAVEGVADIRMTRGRPLVRDVQYIPSLQSVFYHKHRGLDAAERAVFLTLISTPRWNFSDPSYATLPVRTRKKLLDVLLDYNAYVQAMGRAEDRERRNRELLQERLGLPPDAEGDHVFPALDARSPSDAPKTTLLAATVRARPDGPHDLVLRVRPANHDLLSSTIGRAPNSALQVFDLAASVDAEGVRVQNFDLVNVQALNTSTTGLPGDGAFAWTVRLGYGDDQAGCTDCGVFRANTFVGYAFGNSANAVIPYALAGGQAQSVHETSGVANLQAKAGFVSSRSERVGCRVEGGWKQPLDGARDPGPFVETEAKLSVSRHGDLRAGFEFERRPVATLAWFWYL